jgi:hypothetical protein
MRSSPNPSSNCSGGSGHFLSHHPLCTGGTYRSQTQTRGIQRSGDHPKGSNGRPYGEAGEERPQHRYQQDPENVFHRLSEVRFVRARQVSFKLAPNLATSIGNGGDPSRRNPALVGRALTPSAAPDAEWDASVDLDTTCDFLPARRLGYEPVERLATASGRFLSQARHLPTARDARLLAVS